MTAMERSARMSDPARMPAPIDSPAGDPIYLDNQATTPMDPRVLEAMMPYLTHQFGNPHSATHRWGWDAEAAVMKARRQVATLIGADADEIVFTSGATEANNLAIKGAALAAVAAGDRRRHLVVSAIEHRCVLAAAERMVASHGFELTVVPPGPDGIVPVDAVVAALRDDTLLVSVMAVNNEIGTVQPVAEIAVRAHERGALVHTDAAQAAGRIPLDLRRVPVDMLSLSGHKIYGPKGVGALFVRRGIEARIEPLFDGGRQERGLRAGTLPTPLVVGLGEAARLARQEGPDETIRIGHLHLRLLDRLRAAGLAPEINGAPFTGMEAPGHGARVPHNINLSLPGTEADRIIRSLPDLAMSAGSACSSAAVEPSYVLRALMLSEARVTAALRLGLGRFTTEDEIDRAAVMLSRVVGR
ncbi:cysteine desulfurase IscS [Tistrella bauzanensis]|uniref:Cysteine desulfurase n=2 Tax=Tistrella bauzanensis TaxID=657419 RepID=A0ABQ1IEI0_9PROT|nr:cysteine desulfurase IscS [Tistrella bauzanensis]